LWTLLVLTVLAVIAYFRGVKMGVLTLRDKIPGVGLWGSIKCAAKIGIAHFLLSFREALFLVVFLTYQSYFRADGILRTLYRVLISRKHLLEWDTTAQTQKDSRHDLGAFFSFMWPALMIALVIGVLIFSSNPAAFIPAAPFLFSWLVTPLAAYWINHQGIERDKMSELLVEEAIRFYGRRVWRDLESIIDKDHHILPLNFHQKDPGSMIVAHTLSTNLLRLPLWAVTAHDLGCIGTIELADSLEHAFERIVKRQNLYSHHLNPHVTQELKLHTPRHILEFENGNLAYYLSTFKQGCVEIVNRPLFGERVLNGLNDTISLLKEEVARAERAQVTKRTDIHPQLHEEIDACAAFLSAQALAEGRQTLTAWRKLVDSLAQHAAIVNQRLTVFSQGSGADNEEIRSWADSLVHQVRELDRDFRMLAPWTSVCTTHLEAIIYQSDASALEAWSHITDTLDRMPSVSHFPATSNAILHELVALRSKICGRALATGLDCTAGLIEFDALVSAIEEALEFSKNILLRYTRVAQQSEAIMKVMDVGSLFDEERRMLLVNSHVSSASWARSQLIV
jgi:hypothetical protein